MFLNIFTCNFVNVQLKKSIWKRDMLLKVFLMFLALVLNGLHEKIKYILQNPVPCIESSKFQKGKT